MNHLKQHLISLFVLFIIVLSATNTLGEIHHVADCTVCHYRDCSDCTNRRFVKCEIDAPSIGSKAVVLTATYGQKSYADGDGVHNGVCEVCHTSTDYHTNTDDGTTHFDGSNCMGCHPHSTQPELFSPITVPGLESHRTHIDNHKGPGSGDCTVCHQSGSYALFADGQPLATTTACDGCHSPDGAYNGTGNLDNQNPDTVAYGAKYNWSDGIYEADGTTVKSGKEKWCISCHDGGTSQCNGVTAPNVDLFYTGGHGRPGAEVECIVCHDPAFPHTDGEPRTYAFETTAMWEPANSGVAYAAGYRLRYVGQDVPLMIPALKSTTFGWEEELMKATAYRRCFASGCHDSSKLFELDLYGQNEVGTNFTQRLPDPPMSYSAGLYGWGYAPNQHYEHLLGSYAMEWDSDWDVWTGNVQFGDDMWVPLSSTDAMYTCSSCHNVHGATGSHGSTNEAMMRDGRLEGMVPASGGGWTPRIGLGFTYVVEDIGAGGYPWVTSDGATQWTSVGAIVRNDPSGVNYGCFCHSPNAAYGGSSPGTSYDASAFKTVYTGYHAGGTSGPIGAVLEVSGSPWTPDELVGSGFFVKNFSDGSRGQMITANTENTVTVSGLQDGNDNMWHNGDAAYIYDHYGYERSYLEYYRPYWDLQTPYPTTRYLQLTVEGEYNGTTYHNEILNEMCTLLGFAEPSVTLSPPGGAYDRGTEVEMTAIPGDAGWQFISWDTVVNYTRSTISTDNPATITVNAHRVVIATFERTP
ncbi:MAG: hypothetical protein SWQ30_08185 [Thermodesulfobacteriota bacterium]|nr:hypothetical protein [Thermodesulfobacteriota bacterium]